MFPTVLLEDQLGAWYKVNWVLGKPSEEDIASGLVMWHKESGPQGTDRVPYVESPRPQSQ